METSVAGNASLESCCLDYHCCCDKRCYWLPIYLLAYFRNFQALDKRS
ncbi:hypothetical protein V6Z11_A12G038500 [Gossypium hirsutum]